MLLRCFSERKSEICSLSLVLVVNLGEGSFSVVGVGARGK